MRTIERICVTGFGLVVLSLSVACNTDRVAGIGTTSDQNLPEEGMMTGAMTDTITCASATSPIVSQGDSATINFTTSSVLGPLSFQVVAHQSASAPASLGTVTPDGATSATYSAPASVPASFDVDVYASTADNSVFGVCSLRVIAANALGIPDEQNTQGIVGTVYQLPPYAGPGGADPATNPSYAYAPPDFSTLTPVLTIDVNQINVPDTSWSIGFPGYPQLVEWFGIRFEATLTVPTAGSYVFQTGSDDGSRLYIDGQLVVNNTFSDDNWKQAFTTRTGAPVTLTAGDHAFRFDYIQGPRYYLGLIVSWQAPGATDFEVIPSNAYSRPK